MEKIFEEMIASDRTEREKLAIVDLIISSAPKPGTNPNQQTASRKLIRSTIDAILNGKDAFLIKQSFRVFEAWSTKEIRTSFFTPEEVSALLQEDCANPIGAITLLMDVMQSLKDSDDYGELCLNVAGNASNFVARHRRFGILYKFCAFLQKFPECVPRCDELFTLCYSLLNSVCFMEQPTTGGELVEYVTGCPAVIGGLFKRVWKAKSNHRVTMQCLEMIFPLMVSARDNRVSFALGAVVQFVPDKLMTGTIEDITKTHVMSDEQMANVVSRLIDWLAWPKITNISNWLLLLLGRISAAGRFELLKQLADEYIPKLLPRLTSIALRDNNVRILVFLVTGNQDSKKTFTEALCIALFLDDYLEAPRPGEIEQFQMLVKGGRGILKDLLYSSVCLVLSIKDVLCCWTLMILFVPTLYQSVKRERKLESDKFLADFSVLIRSLVLFHADKPEAYKKSIPHVIGDEDMYEDDYEVQFKKQSWTAKSKSVRAVPVKAIPGKTGLRNGANICFLNSSIQLLAISESYSEQFIRRNFPLTARISNLLQKYFVFLKFSNRPWLHFNGIARQLLPSSFTWGAVQDSSEFFSHLIDSTMEEEKPYENFEKLAKENFYCTVVHSHRCLNCENVTQLKVPNIDLGLAFDSEATQGNFGIRGGNQSSCSSDTKSESEDYVLLEDMISSFFKAEEVGEYDCDKCIAVKQVAEKRTTFCETPNFLKVTLNRFSYDHRGPQKITKATDIPRTLVVPVHRENSLEHHVFCLVGTIVHVGVGANSGHYYSIARNQTIVDRPPSITDISSLSRDSDFFEDRWFEFNDEDISLTSFDAFARSSSSSLSTPYVILYKKVTDAVLADVESLLSADAVRIPKSVLQSVAKDNEEYEKEQEVRKRPRSPASPRVSWRKDNDDDDSPNPPNNFHEGPRMVF